MCEILIIRHGETAWNRDQVFRGRADVPLSERGREQAHLLAASLKHTGIEAIYCSPLSRAQETTAPLAAALGIAVTTDERLIDFSFGEWEGRSRAEIETSYPDLYQLWHNDPQRFRAPGGESLSEASARVWPALEEIAQKHMSGVTAFISHRVICKLLLLTAVGAGLEAFWRIRLDTASVSAIERTESGWVVTRVNDTHHMWLMSNGGRPDF